MVDSGSIPTIFSSHSPRGLPSASAEANTSELLAAGILMACLLIHIGLRIKARRLRDFRAALQLSDCQVL